MVKYVAPPLDRTFSALADPTRRAILARLAEGEAAASQLAEPFDISLPATLKHLGVLEKAGLIARTKEGRVSRCRLVGDPLKDAAEWIAHYRRFWERQLDALAEHLAETPREDG
jgi:DNA-binding transcriptional ArsR family regulator